MIDDKRLGVALAVALCAAGCAAEEQAWTQGSKILAVQQSSLRVVLHDAPTDEVDEVWIEFSGVSVHGAGGWQVVSGETQAVELLGLQNGVVAELAFADLAPGQYDQLRFDITNSWVVVDGVREDLRIPSGKKSGLKLPHVFSIAECGVFTLSIDWDAGAHLSHNPKHGYQLRPVLEVDDQALDESVCDDSSGSSANDIALFKLATDDHELYALSSGGIVLYGQDDGTLVDAAGALANDHFTNPGHPVALWTPAPGVPDMLVGAADDVEAITAMESPAWNWSAPCCNTERVPPAIDRTTGQMYLGAFYRVYQRSVSNGQSRGMSFGGDRNGFIGLIPGQLWKAGTAGTLTLHARGSSLSGYATWWTKIADLPLRPPAIASDDSVVVSAGGGRYMSSNVPGPLARATTGRTLAWKVEANTITPPIIAAGDIILVGTSPIAGTFAVDAYSIDGTLLWSAPLEAEPTDLVAGDDGVVYVAAGPEVLGFEVGTGIEVSRIYDLAPVTDLLLGDGVLYAAGGGFVTGLPVTATGLDPAASWPARFHDSQRSSQR